MIFAETANGFEEKEIKNYRDRSDVIKKLECKLLRFFDLQLSG